MARQFQLSAAALRAAALLPRYLFDMLRVIDGFNVFDRSDGIAPFLLLDGHGSRFELPFLKYINTSQTKWKCMYWAPVRNRLLASW